MKPGDLVKRKSHWIEWMKHNLWCTLEEEQEIGIITKFDSRVNGDSMDVVVVFWSNIRISWENVDDLEVINESG